VATSESGVCGAAYLWVKAKSMVAVLKRNSPKGRLSAVLKRMARTKQPALKRNGLGQFVGAIHFEGDPVKVQKEMRREKR